MIESLRWTGVVSKIIDRKTESATAADVFNAATLGGARSLNREDLGRIAPGAKAGHADLGRARVSSWRRFAIQLEHRLLRTGARFLQHHDHRWRNPHAGPDHPWCRHYPARSRPPGRW